MEITPVTEALQLSTQELKRADHSIAVSLKYTRTVDVIRSIVERLINTVGFALDALLAQAKENKKITEIPQVFRIKVEEAKRLYAGDKLIKDFCDFYLLLRRVHKAKFERSQEYRRHVTMTAHMDDGQSIEITIDIITDYFERTKEFLGHVHKIIHAD
ncbi:hypothetical protein HY489_04720 [Candidatus Woesearchaeota archaeon]|nr:hypothetical protein [Candidatus Woesearchaeota archaeon]